MNICFSTAKKLSCNIITLLMLLINSHSFGQDDVYFEHLTTKDGLSQSDVNCIYQDKQGLMWFGTHDGLNKYNGYNFTVYNLDPNNPKSINSNLIFAISGDKNDNLWIGTSGNGINYFNKSTEEFYGFTHDENNPNSLGNNQIISILVDSKNRLWVGTSNGLDFTNLNTPLESLKFKHYLSSDLIDNAHSLKNSISKIFEDSLGQIWVGSVEGLFKFNEDKSTFQRVGNQQWRVHTIIEDSNKNLFLGINSALFTMNLMDFASIPVRFWISDPYGQISNLLISNNKIWGGTSNGLLEFDYSDKSKQPEFANIYTYNAKNENSLSKNIVRSSFVDKTGIIWIGTNGGGVNKFDPHKKKFLHVKNTLDPKSLSYDKIRSIYEDSNGYLWIGTEGGALNMLPKQKNKNNYLDFKQFPNIQKSFAITEIKKGKRKILLIGGEANVQLHELDITNPNNIQEVKLEDFRGISGSVFALLEDSNKNLWIGSYNKGIHRWLYDATSDSYKKDILSNNIKNPSSIPSDIIRNMLEDSSGNIWFATGNGLAKLDKNEIYKPNPKFIVYKNIPSNKNSISHNYILELFESTEGDIWIGTFGGGLNKFIPSQDGKLDSFKSYRKEDGLPNNVIKGILEDNDKNLWISTNKGLSKFNPSDESFKIYDVNDGLQDDEFQELARLKRKNGDLLFGGINGFNAFNPKDIKDNTHEAETLITGFSISNKPVEIGEKVNGRIVLNKSIESTSEFKLHYNENSLSFEFAALHFSSPEKNNFAYMLEGFDKEWVYTDAKRRYATYTNLNPGDYTLKVKASNSDGIWDSTPSMLNITIYPPYWLTNIAFGFYGVLIIIALLLYRRYTIISTSKKHSLELEHIEKEKNEELQRIKLEFFTNITHEFTTPLTLIKGPLNYLQKEGENINKNVVQEQYKLMQKNTDYLLRLITQLLDFRKINQGKMRLVMRKSKIVEFIKEVSEPFQFLAQKSLISFHIDSTDDDLETWFDHDALEKIMNNLLSNAFKFTPDEGEINVKISLDKTHEELFESKGKKHKYVYIEVKDSGAGMDKAKVENIFERFFSEKNLDKKNSRGMGIGLSFVKDIVELHQGGIAVKSQPNEGTNFIVRLPIEKNSYINIPEITCKEISESDFHVRSSESDSLAISINDEIVDESLTPSKSELPALLIVDDNEDIRSFIKLALGKKYKIYTAENGQEGLEIANKIIPKIIVSDIMMPIMDGIELLEKLKNQKETSHIPVVLLTAKLSQENEIKGLKTGADAYIRKPFDVELLELKLNNILKYREELRSRFNLEISLQPKEVTVTSLDERFLQQAMEIVEKHMMNTDFNVEMLVREMGYSRTNLYTKFKEITGLSSSEFIRNIRLKRAVQLFKQSDLSVKEIMYMTGFNTSSYFAKCFKKQFGVIPSEYVRQGTNDDASSD